jgi:hypothetical protein
MSLNDIWQSIINYDLTSIDWSGAAFGVTVLIYLGISIYLYNLVEDRKGGIYDIFNSIFDFLFKYWFIRIPAVLLLSLLYIMVILMAADLTFVLLGIDYE